MGCGRRCRKLRSNEDNDSRTTSRERKTKGERPTTGIQLQQRKKVPIRLLQAIPQEKGSKVRMRRVKKGPKPTRRPKVTISRLLQSGKNSKATKKAQRKLLLQLI